MNTATLLKGTILTTPKGALFSVTLRRTVETLAAAAGHVIEKQSTITLRNAPYANMKAVKEGVANGDREAPTLNRNIVKVIWEGIGGAYIALTTTGKEVVAAPQNQVDNVIWYFDGEQVEKESIKHFLNKKDRESVDLKEKREEAREKCQELFVTIGIDNIILVNGR
jgi:hypothetical protein